jgi:hypothetical protein
MGHIVTALDFDLGYFFLNGTFISKQKLIMHRNTADNFYLCASNGTSDPVL